MAGSIRRSCVRTRYRGGHGVEATGESWICSEKTLNCDRVSASGELARPVASLQKSLQFLNLGVACWTRISGGEDEDLNFWRQEVGYARVKGVWCLALRTSEGNQNYPDSDDVEMWPFNEAPLYLRIKAVDKLPELIESLVSAAEATACLGWTTESRSQWHRC